MIQINKHIQSLKPSATLQINEAVKKARAQGHDIVHFGFGQSPFPIHHSIIKSLKEHAHNNHYLPSLGLDELRTTIARFLNRYQGINAKSDYIFIGPGSKELLYHSILILEGRFLIPKGSWVSYGPQIQSKGIQFDVLETEFSNDFKLKPETLYAFCKADQTDQHILILNSPNNPTGAVYNAKELEALAEVCRQFGVIVLSDEIYSQLSFHQSYAPSMASFYPERTVVYGGLSKVFSAGGYRMGFMALPRDLEPLKDNFKSLFSESFSAVASPVQYAAVTAFSLDDDLHADIVFNKKILHAVSKYLKQELESLNISCTRSEGAFYMMVGFEAFATRLKKRGISSNYELANYLLSEFKVAILPGVDFYFQTNELFCRLAFVDFDGIAIKQKVGQDTEIDISILKRFCPNIFKGIDRMRAFCDEFS